MHAQFELLMPESVDETLRLLAQAGAADAVVPLAGGTNVIVDLRARTAAPEKLVALGNLDELRYVRVDSSCVRIGGRTTLTDILLHPDMRRCAASLVAAIEVFGGQMVRNAATVAGNICYGSPAADLVPPLLALDAEVTLAAAGESRTLALCEFFLGYKRTARRPDELITEIAWPLPGPNAAHLFHKLARRRGDAITVVGIAVGLTVESGTCTSARVALGAVAPVVKRATEAEQLLQGRALSAELIETAARRAVEASDPIDDVRASAAYRRHGVYVLTRRLLTQAWDRATARGVDDAP